MSKKNTKNKQEKFGLFFLGTTVGALAGMMLAQKKGSELRKELSDTAEVIKEKAVEILENREEVIENIKEVIEKVMSKDEIIKYDKPDYYEKEFDIEEDEDDEKQVLDASEFEVAKEK